MAEEQLRCLVTGATGYIGGRLVPRLLESGFTVRALARNPDKLANVPWRNRIEAVRGDLGEPESLDAAFQGVDVIYYLVHSMGFEKDFATEERRAAQNVVAAARKAGVRRIVYLSGLHPEGTELSTHLGSPKWVHNKIQPIAIRDVLHYLVAAATCPVPTSRTWDIGGPDVLEYGDMMQIYADVAGLRPRRILVLPVLTPRIAALWVGLVTPIPSGLARPLVESLHCDAVMNNHDIDTIIPPPEGGLTPYRRAVSLALARIARGEVETTWNTGTAANLPSDPEWAGEVVYTDTRARHTTASPEQLWKAVEASLPSHWHVVEREPGLLKLRSEHKSAGDRWLEVRIEPDGNGSRYEQRAIFYPRGLPGRAYWYAARPLQAVSLDRRVRRVTSAVR